jgi:PAS domain S-box-containing protein
MGRETAEERLRLITDTISEVVWISTADSSQLIYVSPAYERVWGRTCESLYRDPRSFLDAVHPDDRARVLTGLETHQKKGQPFEHEYRIVRPDGTVRWICDRGYPERNPAGHIVRFAGVAQDVTERKLAEHGLAAVAERLELVSRATRDAIWDWNIVSHVTWWSDVHYEELGYPRDTPPSFEAWAARVHPDDRPRVMEGVKRALHDKQVTYSDEYQFLIPNAEPRIILDRAYILYDAAGNPARMVGAMMDVTDQRRLERQLRQAQKVEAVGQLAGSIAHDFNNVLSLIIGHAEMLLCDLDEQDGSREGIDEIRSAAMRAADLTRQLLIFARQQHVQPKPTTVSNVLNEMSRMLRRLVGEDVELTIDGSGQTAKVLIDAGQLTQVVLNLVVNARDAMPSGGLLTISAKDIVFDLGGAAQQPEIKPGAYVMLLVSDTGIGMDTSTQARIFDPFFTTKEPPLGTGLGLATVSGIVAQWGGIIVTTSELGRGTTFKIYVPQAEPEAWRRELAVAPKAASTLAPSREKTLLLVEDDHRLRTLLRTALQKDGYRVMDAANGREALMLCESEGAPIDLLLTDVVMPLMSGRELAERVAKVRRGIKVLYMSGYTAGILDNHGLASAGLELLQKPIAPNALLSKVRELLQEQ